jgi:hypothetical protein
MRVTIIEIQMVNLPLVVEVQVDLNLMIRKRVQNLILVSQNMKDYQRKVKKLLKNI